MGAIYRYEVPVGDQRKVFVLYGDIVHVGGRTPYAVEFWAEHNDGMGKPGTRRTFLVVGTGHDLPRDFVRHVGTSVCGPLVWHLIEVGNQPT